MTHRPEPLFKFEALSMPGWHVKRHLTQAQLDLAIEDAKSDHTVSEWRVSEDVPPQDFGREYE